MSGKRGRALLARDALSLGVSDFGRDYLLTDYPPRALTGLETPMQCPKCGLVQENAPECRRCGIVIAKYSEPIAPSSTHQPPSGGKERLLKSFAAFVASLHVRSLLVGALAGVAAAVLGVYSLQLIPMTEERLARAEVKAERKLQSCRASEWMRRFQSQTPNWKAFKENPEGPRYVLVDENDEVTRKQAEDEALYQRKLREVKEACHKFQDAYRAAGEAKYLYLRRVVGQK